MFIFIYMYILKIFYSLLASSAIVQRTRFIENYSEAFNFKVPHNLKILDLGLSHNSKHLTCSDNLTSLASKTTSSFHLINDYNDSQIPVRLIDANGDMLGIFPLRDAHYRAKMQNMDLVQISSDTSPTICKILDYGKFYYQKQKQDKVKFSRQRSQCMKEIHVTSRIADNDLRIKCQNAIRFLSNGNQVKFSLFLRGREKNHPELATKIFSKVGIFLKEVGQAQKETNIGGIVYQIYTPKSSRSKSGKINSKATKINLTSKSNFDALTSKQDK